MKKVVQGTKLTAIDRWRSVVIALGLMVLFSVLIVQFFRIQVVQGEHWGRVAEGQHFFTVTEPFLRGSFFSNTAVKEGHPEQEQAFVAEIRKYHLHADPQAIPEEHREEIAEQLTTRLAAAGAEKGKITEELQKRSRSRRLVMWLDEQQRDSLFSWWNSYARKRKIPRNALFFVGTYQRSYPFGKLLGQVLHTVRDSRDEQTGQGIPTGGLELQFHDVLKGEQGHRRLMRSPRNSLAIEEVINAPQDGADVILTVNHILQAIAEEEIAAGVEKAKAKCGWAVMMAPHTGEILALAQYPFFHPDHYREYFNDPERLDDTRVKAISDAQEPGSSMKPLTLAVAMLANEELARRGQPPIFDPEEKIPTASGRFPGRRDLTDTRTHNYLNMFQALQKSSNIYVARLVERVIGALGEDWYRAALQDTFGFGKKTGIELPGETAGVLPTPGKVLPSGLLEWSVPTPFSLAIGHNLQVNTIQMLQAYSIFANGGYLVKPTLVKKIVRRSDSGEQTLLDNTTAEKRNSFPRVLDPAIVQEIVRAMKYVTKYGGSGRRANVGGYTEAGKTSTARKIVNGRYSRDKHMAMFVGFIPVTEPAFVLLVAVDEPEARYEVGVGYTSHGGVCAAPVFREIARRSLEYLGIGPDDPYGYAVGDPRYDPEKADWAEENRRLAEIYREWNN